MKKVYGIDLGTTYSCISVVDEHNKPIVFNNAEGQRTTASVVYFEEDGINPTNIIVGSSAKDYAQMYPSNVVSYVKRQMGTDYVFDLNEASYRAETLSSLILKKLVNDMETVYGEKVEDVVITVPAYFGVNEREATKQAGEIAGLNVISLINEPTAAALAYGMSKTSNKRILVYDLGGGTFDVTLINVTEEGTEVIVTGGDHNLGGKNWDDTIVEYLMNQYETQTGSKEDILDNPETAQLLQLEAEKAKMTLTNRTKAPIVFMHNVDRVRTELSREKFEELTAPLLERTIQLTNKMIEDAASKGPGYDKFDEIILVGGSTRMVQIKERLVKEYGVEPIVFDPDEAVAKGAAIYGQQKNVQESIVEQIVEMRPEMRPRFNQEEKAPDLAKKQLLLLSDEEKTEVYKTVAQKFKLAPANIEKLANHSIKNVTSKSFGVRAFAEINGQQVVRIVNLIKKNDTLPRTEIQEFGTFEDNQPNVVLKVYESEVLDDLVLESDGLTIGDALLEIPAGLPAGSPIQVTFKLNEDGRLEVTGVEMSHNLQVSATIETNSVIQQKEMEETKKAVEQFNFA